MRLLIAAVGKLKQGPDRELFAHYLARTEPLGRKLNLPLTVIEIAESRSSSVGARCQAEAQTLLAKIPAGFKLIGLDRKGDQLSSEAFAHWLTKLRDGGTPGVAFMIGGAEGLGGAALDNADKVLSLGPMTLPHGLARIVLAEQIYRAETLLSGHPYHRG
jgi:23S rRNA (pseudouridine1915-N3)-methyltransferase